MEDIFNIVYIVIALAQKIEYNLFQSSFKHEGYLFSKLVLYEYDLQ